MASILADRVEAATGIRPHVGTLDTPGELDADNDMVIDTLPLDYSILEEIDYQYPASNAYYAYMTRGCVNKCKFCAVPKLEPVYKQFLPVADQVRTAEARYGAKRDLLLLDNNVLASCRFNDIIDDIKKAGFSNDATYIEPNAYEIAIQNLRDGQNDKGYICLKLFKEMRLDNPPKPLATSGFCLNKFTIKKPMKVSPCWRTPRTSVFPSRRGLKRFLSNCTIERTIRIQVNMRQRIKYAVLHASRHAAHADEKLVKQR